MTARTYDVPSAGIAVKRAWKKIASIARRVWLAGIERPPVATVVGGVIVICAVIFQVTQGTGRFSRGRTFRRWKPWRSARREPAPAPAGVTGPRLDPGD